MKTSILKKCAVTLILSLICSFSMNALSHKNYLYDTKEDNGKITSKTVYLQEENGMLNKQVHYEFTYNKEGKVAQKKAYRWNKNTQRWMPFYQISYQYQENDDCIETTYGLWNSQKKDFSLNKQTIRIPASNYDEIFS